MSIGPSLNVGVDKPDGSNQETFEQALAGLTYQPTEKINLYVHGGVEIRQEAAERQLPVRRRQRFNRGLDESDLQCGGRLYPVRFDHALPQCLSIRLFLHRCSSQNVTTTGVGVEATQRFFQRIFLGFSLVMRTMRPAARATTPSGRRAAAARTPTRSDRRCLIRPRSGRRWRFTISISTTNRTTPGPITAITSSVFPPPSSSKGSNGFH